MRSGAVTLMITGVQWAKVGNIHVVHQLHRGLPPVCSPAGGGFNYTNSSSLAAGQHTGTQLLRVRWRSRRHAATNVLPHRNKHVSCRFHTSPLAGGEETRSWQGGECWGSEMALTSSWCLADAPLEGQHWNGEDSHSQQQVGFSFIRWESHAGQHRDREEEEEEDMQACSSDHLQSTSRMALTVRVSSFASWVSVAAVHGLFL